jgi:hypothetical protein
MDNLEKLESLSNNLQQTETLVGVQFSHHYMDIIKNLLGEYMFCLLDTRAVIEILQITVDVS